MEITTQNFKDNVKESLKDVQLQTALQRATKSFTGRRKLAVESLENFEDLRDYCGAVKAHTLSYLDYYLEQLTTQIEKRGGKVHFAEDGEEANRIIIELAKARHVKTVVKAKSMISEETHLNDALEQNDIIPIETDLGEYILQIDGDVPSHIIAPVLHRTREYITQLFHEKLGTSPDATPSELTKTARKVLREGFLNADMGISGVNFAVAETGTIVLVENEGNIRFTTSMPRIHVAVMGLEKVVPRLKDLPAFMAVLPRSATGQKASSYVSVITGAKREGDPEGPEEFHLVVVDSGRSSVLADPKLRDALRCIRCGAILNAGQRLGAIETDNPNAELMGIAYFAVDRGKQLATGMDIRITPSTVQRERYGSIEGRIAEVSAFPVTTDAVTSMVGNAEMAQQMTNGQSVIQVLASLLRDERAATGFKWTSGRGPREAITAGTTAAVRATVEYRRPITFLLPILRQWTGVG